MDNLSTLVQTMANGVRAMERMTQAINAKFPNWVDVPATATSAGVAGQVAYNATHIYICVDANVWRRVATSTF